MNPKHPRRAFCEWSGASLLGTALGCNASDRSAAFSSNDNSTDAGPLASEPALPGSLSAPVASGGSGGLGSSNLDAGSTPESSPHDAAVVSCEQSAPDIEGPFYREGMPVRDVLDLYGEPGERLQLSGVVMDLDCTPIQNAVVELWHASPALPGTEAGQPDATYDASGSFRYYGQIASDAQGRYRFTTLRPGWYLNGAAYRPAHLHLKVWVGNASVARLTTQLYFEGDPFNENDPWFNAEMMLSPDPQGSAVINLVVEVA